MSTVYILISGGELCYNIAYKHILIRLKVNLCIFIKVSTWLLQEAAAADDFCCCEVVSRQRLGDERKRFYLIASLNLIPAPSCFSFVITNTLYAFLDQQ